MMPRVVVRLALLLQPGLLLISVAGFRSHYEGPLRQQQDCLDKSSRAAALSQLRQAEADAMIAGLPGAGMDPKGDEPYKRVRKDGYFAFSCSKDFLFHHGDKFGKRKHGYKLDGVANVSITHYTDIVPWKDQKMMTHEVCFKFCRGLQKMSVFGIVNGRDCYCAPYAKAMAGDSSQCDSPCDGRPTEMCGGKDKSSLFIMFHCGHAEARIKKAGATALMLKKDLIIKADDAMKMSKFLAKSTKLVEKSLKAVGDEAAFLMQVADVIVDELNQTSVRQSAFAETIDGQVDEALALQGDFRDFDIYEQAIVFIDKLNGIVQEVQKSIDYIQFLMDSASPRGSKFKGATGAAQEYRSIMWYVERDRAIHPATCMGNMLDFPMIDLNLDECAFACDNQRFGCRGFQYLSGKGKEPFSSLCFLYSDFDTTTFYTGCGGGGASFLAKRQLGPPDAPKDPIMVCMAKRGKFMGMYVPAGPKGWPQGFCRGCLRKTLDKSGCPSIAEPNITVAA